MHFPPQKQTWSALTAMEFYDDFQGHQHACYVGRLLAQQKFGSDETIRMGFG